MKDIGCHARKLEEVRQKCKFVSNKLLDDVEQFYFKKYLQVKLLAAPVGRLRVRESKAAL
jgi:hypothetical protein